MDRSTVHGCMSETNLVVKQDVSVDFEQSSCSPCPPDVRRLSRFCSVELEQCSYSQCCHGDCRLSRFCSVELEKPSYGLCSPGVPVVHQHPFATVSLAIMNTAFGHSLSPTKQSLMFPSFHTNSKHGA